MYEPEKESIKPEKESIKPEKESIKAVAKGTGRDGARLMPFVDSISFRKETKLIIFQD
jgi:hypothetical protein